MTDLDLDEDFDRSAATVDPRLRWRNPPPRCEIANSRLIIATAAGTDFWQRTHYGFRADNGHCLSSDWVGDFVLATAVRFHPMNQYDQAGLIVRLSAECWLKTSVEFEPEGSSRLGAVVTNNGWSDWSTQDVPRDLEAIQLRIRREGADYIVDYSPVVGDSAPSGWSQIRMAHLAEDRPGRAVECGLYACSPKAAGFVAEFEYLRIRRGRIGPA